MRMWMVNPELLCRAHLLGEHGEIHKHRRMFVRGVGIARRRGQIEPASMGSRHDVLAAEMKVRGYSHSSPYEQPDLAAYDLAGFTVDPERSAMELRARCPECRERIGRSR